MKTASSLASPDARPAVLPRLLQWSRYLGGLLVETQFIIGCGDVQGLVRLGEMVRVEFGAGVSGNC